VGARGSIGLSALSGAAFVALVTAALFVLPDAVRRPIEDSAQLASALREGHSAVLAAAFLAGLASACFIWFVGAVRSQLRQAEGETSPLSAVATIGGSAGAALVLAASAAWTGAATRAASAGPLVSLAESLLLVASFALAVFGTAASLVLIETGALSALLGRIGLPIAALQILAAGCVAASGPFSPQGAVRTAITLAGLAWIVALSLACARQGTPRAPSLPPQRPSPPSRAAVRPPR